MNFTDTQLHVRVRVQKVDIPKEMMSPQPQTGLTHEFQPECRIGLHQTSCRHGRPGGAAAEGV